ncbi:MAG: trigger factor [Gammaproteobacteria bacterium]|nr:trigger factor [Gammaproteobacteria bacterium]
MQVTVDTVGSLGRRLTVRIPEEHVAAEIEQRLAKLLRTARIDGFRVGKVPRRLIEQRYGAELRREVVGEMLRTSYRDALQQERLRPAGEAQIEPLPVETGEGFAYHATFEVYPEVRLTPVEALHIEVPQCTVQPDDLDRAMELLRHRHRGFNPVTRPAQHGDRIEIDYEASVDGQRFEGGEAQGMKVDLGVSRLLDGFTDGLYGALPGEARTLDLRFPDDYVKQALAGRPVQFAVLIKTVSEPVLPALDDVFARELRIEQGGIERLRARVREGLEGERDHAIHALVKRAVLQALAAAHPVEIPEALVQDEALRLSEAARQDLRLHGVETPDDLAVTAFQGEARRRMAVALVVAEVIRSQGLKADPARVRAAIEGLGAAYQEPAAVVNWYYADRSRLATIEAAVLEDAVVEWVVARAQVQARPITFDALLNPGQTEHGHGRAP